MAKLKWYISSQEFLALKNDIKPVIRQGIEKGDVNILGKLLKKEKMCILPKTLDIPRSVNEHPISHKKSIVAYISKSMKLARDAYHADKENDQLTLGKLLGYPECCVNFYQYKIPHPTGDDFSFVLHTFHKTEGKPSFYTNNIFNLQTRVNTAYKLKIFNRFKNILGNQAKYFLISHLPCSYRCKESMKTGKKILKFLKEEDREFAKNVVYSLKKIFLVMDDFNFISFDGRANGNSIYYQAANPFLTACPSDKFTRGNKVIVDGNEIKILKDGDLLHKAGIPIGNAKILDFRCR